MASDLNKPPSKSPPNFTFPPKYLTTTPSPPTTQPKCSTKSPPKFNFPFFPPPKPTPSQNESSASKSTSPPSPVKESTFLTIPLEIRLQIYTHILLSHPIQHPHLLPSVTPSSTQSMLSPLGLSYPSSSTSPNLHPNQNQNQNPSPNQHQYQHQPSFPAFIRGKLPTALLLTCRQVLAEAKAIPFSTGTFVFVNWFWSGVFAASSFMKALRPWQAEAVRWVRVEVLARDLVAGEGGGREWRDLCKDWRGVRGLGLVFRGSVGVGVGMGMGEGGLLSVGREWVREGLGRMGSLRVLEVEVEDRGVRREEKVAFCEGLEGVLNEGEREWEGRVRVIFVEKKVLVEEEVEVKDIEEEGAREEGRWQGGYEEIRG